MEDRSIHAFVLRAVGAQGAKPLVFNSWPVQAVERLHAFTEARGQGGRGWTLNLSSDCSTRRRAALRRASRGAERRQRPAVGRNAEQETGDRRLVACTTCALAGTRRRSGLRRAPACCGRGVFGVRAQAQGRSSDRGWTVFQIPSALGLFDRQIRLVR